MRSGPNAAGLSRKAIMTEVDHSLRRLGTDYDDGGGGSFVGFGGGGGSDRTGAGRGQVLQRYLCVDRQAGRAECVRFEPVAEAAVLVAGPRRLERNGRMSYKIQMRGGDGNRTRVRGFAGLFLSHSDTPPGVGRCGAGIARAAAGRKRCLSALYRQREATVRGPEHSALA